VPSNGMLRALFLPAVCFLASDISFPPMLRAGLEDEGLATGAGTSLRGGGEGQFDLLACRRLS